MCQLHILTLCVFLNFVRDICRFCDSVVLYAHMCLVQSNQRISVDWKVPSAVCQKLRQIEANLKSLVSSYEKKIN